MARRQPEPKDEARENPGIAEVKEVLSCLPEERLSGAPVLAERLKLSVAAERDGLDPLRTGGSGDPDRLVMDGT